MPEKVVKVANLSQEDFVLNQQTKKIEIVVTRKIYVGSWASGVSSGSSDENFRRLVTIQDGFGTVHIDFTTSRQVGVLLNLPAQCPTPQNTIETQTHDGGYVWLVAGERQVRCSGLRTNTRYIVDLVGYFQQ